MKRHNKYAILSITGLLLAGLMLFGSCKDEKDEENMQQRIEIIRLENITPYIHCDMSIQNDTLLLINSEKELETASIKVLGLDFNFADRSLIVVRGVTPTGRFIRGEAQMTKNKSKYVMSIDVKLDGAAISEKWQKAYLTPFKLKDDSEVKLNIDYTWMYKIKNNRITNKKMYNP